MEEKDTNKDVQKLDDIAKLVYMRCHEIAGEICGSDELEVVINHIGVAILIVMNMILTRYFTDIARLDEKKNQKEAGNDPIPDGFAG